MREGFSRKQAIIDTECQRSGSGSAINDDDDDDAQQVLRREFDMPPK